MSKFLKKRSKKSGLPPGTLVHIGEKKIDKTVLEILNYSESNYEEKKDCRVDECLAYREKAGVSWINIEGIHDVSIIEKLGNSFNIHPLVLEDILNTDQRPKIDVFEKNIFIVFKMLSYNEKEEIVTEQVSVVFDSNILISFQEGIEGDVFNPIRERIKNNKGKIRQMETDYLAYRLIDAVIDNYFVILEKIGERIELLEEELIKNPSTKALQGIHKLKREMIFLRKSIWPLREVINTIEKEDSPLISDVTKLYFRDVYDHTIQVMDTIETYRDIISGMLEIYLSTMNNKLNQVMKVLTIIATIFMPPTFIVGIYGMNFKYMPELDSKLGYPIVLVVMLLIVVSMVTYFRKKKWI